ncbi:DUF3325 domain-containing protein [Roseomonas sp. KE2513]|uniref:DUF3325 domain-containing protein n=1 Tax=Roseomonas sp. KE2513 TaxID=2479202 RepID=UPI0018E03EF9|nr:DUF3325 domain-containing protein [Roseomonas sp. KE2513]MBI0536327.1 DUF3325 domain-containing protein [Roseomonas sp. KE2513]
MIGFGASLAYAGFVAMCLAMERHHEQVFRTRAVPPRRRRLLSVLGWLLLVASVLAMVSASGWGLGLVLWAGILTATAIPLSILLTYAPRMALMLAAAPLPAGLALLLSVP